jgi:hypothetical protein
VVYINILHVKRYILIIIPIFLLAYCKQTKTGSLNSINHPEFQYDPSQIKQDSLQEKSALLKLLSDSSIFKNSVPNKSGLDFIPDTLKSKLDFYLITPKLYSQLCLHCIHSNFPEDKFPYNIVRKDSMLILKFSNGSADTLTNRKSRQVKYSLNGFWKENNLVLVNYEDWEDSDFYLISMTSGKYFNLASTYIISPFKTRLLTFSNTLNEPTYSNGFLIARFDKTGIIEEIKVGSDKWAIENACWIDENTLIITISIIDYESFKIKESLYSMFRIK